VRLARQQMFGLLALVFFLATATEVTTEEGVYVLGTDNFDAFLEANEFVLAEFYAPWCGHCKTLAPEYAKAAQSLESSGSPVKLAKIDATVHAELGTRFGVQGYPTLKFFRSGNPTDYEGGRKEAEIVSWLLKKSGPPSTELTTADALDRFQIFGVVIIAYVEAGSADFEAWMALAKASKLDDFTLGHVVDSSVAAGKSGVVLYKKGEDPVQFEGVLSEEALNKWVLTEGFPLVDELAQPIWVRAQKTGSPLLAVFHPDTDGETPVLVRNVAKAHKGKAFFSLSGRVQLLEQWGGSGKVIPSAIMILWKEGEPKFRIWNEENGLAFNEENLNAFVTQTLDGTYQAFLKSEPVPVNEEGTVHTLVGKTFESVVAGDKPVFVEFYAPWCGHCKKISSSLG